MEISPVKFVSNEDFQGWRLPFNVADSFDVTAAYPAPYGSGWVTRPQVFFIAKGEFEYSANNEVYSVTDQTPYRAWGTVGPYRFTCVSQTGEAICLTPVDMKTQWQAERISIPADTTHTVPPSLTRQYIYVMGTAMVAGVSVTDDLAVASQGADTAVVAGPDGCQILHIHTPEAFNMQYRETRPAEISEPIR